MRSDIELAYAVIEVPDPQVLTPFFADVIGLTAGEPGRAGTLTWRNDGRAHRIIAEPGPANDAICLGFEATSDAAFEQIAAGLSAAGYAVHESTPDDRAARRVRRLFRTAAPWGIAVEVCTGLAEADHVFFSRLVPGGFRTKGEGFGHTVFATTAFDESHRFLIDGLGMRQSDWVELTIAEGVELEVRFYHCNQRHHSVALARAPFELPRTLHHMMFETNERDDVGTAFDRAWSSGLGIPSGLGLHDNDRMFSFYVESPVGFQVEVGHGARTITDDWSDNRRYDRASVWGHQPLSKEHRT